MVAVMDVANWNSDTRVTREWITQETLFLPHGQKSHVTRHNLPPPSPVSTWKRLHGDVLVGNFNMHVITSHPPPSQRFLFILIMFHIVFLYVQYSTFISHCIDVSTNRICCIHRRSISPYMKLYFYKKMQICKHKGLQWLNLKSLQCLRTGAFLNI